MSGKCFSKTELLFLVSNLEAQSLDIQYCRKKKLKVWDSHELWNTQSPEQITPSPMHWSLLLEFYYLAFLWERAFENKTRGNLTKAGQQKLCLVSIPSSWVVTELVQQPQNKSNESCELGLTSASSCKTLSCLSAKAATAPCRNSPVNCLLNKGFLLMGGFFTQPSRFSHLIGQEYSILA